MTGEVVSCHFYFIQIIFRIELHSPGVVWIAYKHVHVEFHLASDSSSAEPGGTRPVARVRHVVLRVHLEGERCSFLQDCFRNEMDGIMSLDKSLSSLSALRSFVLESKRRTLRSLVWDEPAFTGVRFLVLCNAEIARDVSCKAARQRASQARRQNSVRGSGRAVDEADVPISPIWRKDSLKGLRRLWK